MEERESRPARGGPGWTAGVVASLAGLAIPLLALPAAAVPARAEPARSPRDPPVAADGGEAGRGVGRRTGEGTGDDRFDPPASGAARLAVAAPPYPVAVERVIGERRRACLRAGGTALVSGSGFVRTADLTGDGRTAYLVDFRRARCVGVASLYEGTGGWDLAILVARPGGGLVRVFSDRVLDYDVPDGPGARTVRFRLHGGRCGGVGPDPCFKEHRLDARPFAFGGS